MTRKSGEPDEAVGAVAAGMTRPCLLVVDDDSTIREMLRVALGDQYEVVVLADGHGVIEAIDRHHPRLLILDVNLPGADGFAVCERVRVESRLRRLPVLFITTRADDRSFLKALESGGNSVMIKPFELPALRARVRRLLERH